MAEFADWHQAILKILSEAKELYRLVFSTDRHWKMGRWALPCSVMHAHAAFYVARGRYGVEDAGLGAQTTTKRYR